MIELKKVAHYVSDKIEVASIKTEEYITTDNMLPNRGGVVNCESLPNTKKVARYAPGDILVSNIRPYFKKIWFADRVSGCSNDVIVFRTNDENWNAKFLYYVLSQDIFFDFMMASSNGTKMPRGNKEIISEFLVPDFDIKKQTRIAGILSAYDNLIENNQKQIQLLEEAAQRLYKEWFVDLRFPGYENVSIVDGVPEGWKREYLVDIVDVQYGYAFDGSLFNSYGKGTPIVRIRNIPNGVTSDYTTEDTDENYIVSNGDIVVGMDGEFHINSWCGDSAYLVQRTCKFTPKNPLMQGWLLQAIYEPIKFFEKTVVGATVAHLGKKHIDTIKLLTGTEELYIPLKDLFEKRQILLNQNNFLSEARDRLIPKLMSGELEV